MRFVYTATRSIAIAAGHVLDEQYSIVVGAQQIDPRSRPVGSQSQALDGNEESNLLRIEETWQVRTDWRTTSNELAIFREFLQSVANRETFTFDPYASTDAADDPRTVVLTSRDLDGRRIGTSTYFDFDLTMRRVS